MAKSVKINNVIYQSVPSVNIPLSDGSGSAIFYDASDADATPQFVVAGKTYYGANGKGVGTATFPAVSQDASTKVISIS